MKPVLIPPFRSVTNAGMFRPKMVVWQLTADRNVATPSVQTIHSEPLSTQECLLIIESIARLSRPIIVLTGPDILGRSDLIEITEYAFALGLKVIIEANPEELSDDVVRKFSVFGKRIFRILIDGCIVGGVEERYQQSGQFTALEQAVHRVHDAGLEIHLGATIQKPNVRELAYGHDYAIRRSASGFYCHFCFEAETDSGNHSNHAAPDIDILIDAIAQMKSFGPKDMYFSPQCVRYSHRENHLFAIDSPQSTIPARLGEFSKPGGQNPQSEWLHWCMGGKTFAYIGPTGIVQLCAGISSKCGGLRENGYNFSGIWDRSEVIHNVRENEWSCTETREQFLPHPKQKPIESKP